jgi:antirestriction protein ArdC
MTKLEQRREALHRALDSNSLLNYPAIFAGFMDKGIPEGDIKPRVNVFTYNAWLAKGRQVRKGERGVKVETWIVKTVRDEQTGLERQVKYPKRTTVFHISQTDAA